MEEIIPIEFSNHPVEIIELSLGDYRHNHLSAGFGHTFWVVSAILSECLDTNRLLKLDDSTWWYGKWCDFFKPFYLQTSLEQAEKDGIPVKKININLGNQEFRRLEKSEHVQSEQPKIMQQLLQFNEKTHSIISEKIQAVGEVDLACHLRLGYEMNFSKKNGRGDPIYDESEYVQQVKHLIDLHRLKRENIFCMTDSYTAIDYLRYSFNQPIKTLCLPSYNGVSNQIRNAENLYILLAEIEIAKRADSFIGAQFSQIPNLIKNLRSDNSFII